MSNEKKRAFFEFDDAEKEKIKTIVKEWTKVLQDNQNENGLRTDLLICAMANFTARVCALSAKCSKGNINEAFILESIVSFTMQALRNGGVDIDKQEEEFSKQAEQFEQEQGLAVKPGRHDDGREEMTGQRHTVLHVMVWRRGVLYRREPQGLCVHQAVY